MAADRALHSNAARLEAAFADMPADGVDAAQIADAAVRVWQTIDTALVPLIGPHASDALYRRSLHLASERHAWLSQVHEDPQCTGEFAALREVLAQQPSARAAAASGSLLRVFHDLLSGLMGDTLSDDVLRGVWEQLALAAGERDRPA